MGSWHLDEGSGQVAGDSSGNSNNGQLGSTPSADTNDPTWITGRVGSAALQFNANHFVEVATSNTLEPQKVTTEAWIRHLGQPAFSYILSKGRNGNFSASYAIYTGCGSLCFYVYNGAVTFVQSPDAGVGIWDGNWHHVAGTYDGNMVRFYVDGVEIGSGTPTTLSIGYGLPTHNRFYIGSYDRDSFLSFTGDIDEVKVWNRALSPTEISQSAQTPIPTP